jgi:hypothetical protein
VIGDGGITCIHLVFRGNDLHSGTEPTGPQLTPDQRAEIDQLIQLTGPQNRVAYVNYPNITGVRRSSALSFSPPLGFWNLSSGGSLDRSQRHFTDTDVSFLGSPRDRAQRIGVELVLAFHNATVHSKMKLDFDLDDLLTQMSYTDEGGVRQNLDGFRRYHPVRDIKAIRKWLGYYRWYERTCDAFLIYITKEQYKRHKLPQSTTIFPVLFHQPPPPFLPGNADAAEPFKIIDNVVGLEEREGQVGIVLCCCLRRLLNFGSGNGRSC